MAGFIAMGNDRYIGDYKTDDVLENGNFVEFDHANKTASLAGEGASEIYFVVNEDDHVVEEGIDTLDFRVEKGKYVRAHRPQVGDILVTTTIDGDLQEGDKADVTSDGQVGTNENGRFIVKELTNEYGVETVRLLMVSHTAGEETP